MQADLLPGTTNVVRFPIERRMNPSLDVLRSIAPDVRVVSNTAEAFRLELPAWNLRHITDGDTAQHIADNVDATPGPARRAALEEMLTYLTEKAVSAARAWLDASTAHDDAQERIILARTKGGYWLEPLLERGDTLATRAAMRMIEAHVLREEAEGAARAIRIALRGETWTPFNQSADTDWLIATAGIKAG